MDSTHTNLQQAKSFDGGGTILETVWPVTDKPVTATIVDQTLAPLLTKAAIIASAYITSTSLTLQANVGHLGGVNPYILFDP